MSAEPSAARERPILFSAPMVRALLDGRKTQTRRVVKPQPHHGPVGEMVHLGDGGWAMDDGDLSGLWQCPYGVPGDRLWVKETWKPHSLYTAMKPSEMPVSTVFYAADDGYAPSNTRWHPSIFMPRWASRLTLQITDVRVERLNDISYDDCWAEGAVCDIHGAKKHTACSGLGRAYRKVWEDINGPGSWGANPWVWAVSFALETPPSPSGEG